MNKIELARLSDRDLEMLATGWDTAVNALVDEHGHPLEIVQNINPFRGAKGK